MEALRKQFSDTLEQIRYLADKIEKGRFPTEEDSTKLQQMFDGLASSRREWITLLQSSAVDDRDYSSIDSMDELNSALEEQDRAHERVRAIVDTFLSVRPGDDEYRDELEKYQYRLAGCSEDEVLAMSRSGELEIYEVFCSWIRSGRPAPEKVTALKRYFGYQLAYALLDRELHLPDEEKEEEQPEDSREEIPAEKEPEPREEAEPAAEKETAGEPEPVPEAAEEKPEEPEEPEEAAEPVPLPVLIQPHPETDEASILEMLNAEFAESGPSQKEREPEPEEEETGPEAEDTEEEPASSAAADTEKPAAEGLSALQPSIADIDNLAAALTALERLAQADRKEPETAAEPEPEETPEEEETGTQPKPEEEIPETVSTETEEPEPEAETEAEESQAPEETAEEQPAETAPESGAEETPAGEEAEEEPKTPETAPAAAAVVPVQEPEEEPVQQEIPGAEPVEEPAPAAKEPAEKKPEEPPAEEPEPAEEAPSAPEAEETPGPETPEEPAPREEEAPAEEPPAAEESSEQKGEETGEVPVSPVNNEEKPEETSGSGPEEPPKANPAESRYGMVLVPRPAVDPGPCPFPETVKSHGLIRALVPNVKAFQSKVDRLQPISQWMLPLFTRFGVMDIPMLRSAGQALGWDKSEDKMEGSYEENVAQSAESLEKNNLAVMYEVPDWGPVYCLNDYSYACLHKPSIIKGKNRFGKNYIHYRVSDNRFTGRTEVSGQALWEKLRYGTRICEFLAWAVEQMELKTAQAVQFYESLNWWGDFYSIGLPDTGGYLASTVLLSREEYDGDYPVLFLADTPPEGPFPEGAVVHCFDREKYLVWQEGAWQEEKLSAPDLQEQPRVLTTARYPAWNEKAVASNRQNAGLSPETEEEDTGRGEKQSGTGKTRTAKKKKESGEAGTKEPESGSPAPSPAPAPPEEQSESEDGQVLMFGFEAGTEPAPAPEPEPVQEKKPEQESPAAETPAEQPSAEKPPEEQTGTESPAEGKTETEEPSGEKPAESTGKTSKGGKGKQSKGTKTSRSRKKAAPKPAPGPETGDGTAGEGGTEASAEPPFEEPPPPEPFQGASEFARTLLEQKTVCTPDILMDFTVRLLAENRMAEAVSMAEVMARAPGEAFRPAQHFYQILRQSIRAPGKIYSCTSSTINEMQSGLTGDDPRLRDLEQTMVLSSLLWAMAFPGMAYDHELYNNATMALTEGAGPVVHQLVNLLGGELKDLSFQNDGLGFSQIILSQLAGDGRREQKLRRLIQSAGELRINPTSNISLRGLENCLKLIAGPASPLGRMLSLVEKDDRTKADQIEADLFTEFGDLENADQNTLLEEYIDRAWAEVRRNSSVKQLTADSPARRQCKKAITDRLSVIFAWLDIVHAERSSNFTQYHDRYDRIFSQVRGLLEELAQTPVSQTDQYAAASAVILRSTAEEMLETLAEGEPRDKEDFWFDLCLTPELMLTEDGENVILPELYGYPGLEPWTFLLRAAAAPAEPPDVILREIENYENDRWFRNYGTMELILRRSGQKVPDMSTGLSIARKCAEEDRKSLEGDLRLRRAYGKFDEATLETINSLLELVYPVYLRSSNFASLRGFLKRLGETLDRSIESRAAQYWKNFEAMEANPEFAGAPMLDSIRRSLENQNFNTADSYINMLQGGIRSLPSSDEALETTANYLAQFQECEDGYYQVCHAHASSSPAQWGAKALDEMEEKYHHWTSNNDRHRGLNWLSSWIVRLGTPGATQMKIQQLLLGLGFAVRKVTLRSETRPTGSRPSYEVYDVVADRTPTSLKDYPHPIYRFGTDLSEPMNVVCLFGCKGETTLINTMTGIQPSRSTIVLMDGSLTAVARHQVAATFKTNTSGRSPFLLIDRVLLLYLASLNEGERMKALLRCTLPYTFEVLYGTGSGAVPEEMFIGRVEEMAQLTDLMGPVLVYGGRQLGKTALLNRASKTIHQPAKKEYSFCVDVKDAGSDVLLDRVSRQLKKLDLLEETPASIEDLCDGLAGAYESGRIRLLSVFVDEVDTLFEEFSRSRYEALRPFITLRDSTGQHVKFVFAGTHNVAAMDKAEDGNSNLLHMNSTLCIGPLSHSDAVKLIRIPMSYLGFEIGDQQIELILTQTNSYPGLIHMFCNALVQSVCRDYSKYYSEIGPSMNPPYSISDQQMQAVFREKDIRREIGTRVMSTIKLNTRYRVVSLLLAQMIYEDQESGTSRLYGYTPAELRAYNREQIDLPLITGMTETNLTALLDEMVKMGILWKHPDLGQYRFRQQDFLSYIGSQDTVTEDLFKESEVENAL